MAPITHDTQIQTKVHKERSRLKNLSPQMEQINQQLKDKLTTRQSKIKAWYQDHSTLQQILLGVIIVPLLILLFALKAILLPALATFASLTLLISLKFGFMITKGGVFIYNLLKIFLGVYLSISRSIIGFKAERLRCLQVKSTPHPHAIYPVLKTPKEVINRVELHRRWKSITIQVDGEVSHVFLFSYLRYFILGQRRLWSSLWSERAHYATLWRSSSRAQLSLVFKEVAQSLFTPHLLGPHLNSSRILLPGDACLISLTRITQIKNSEILLYELRISWKEYRLKKAWRLIESEVKEDTWYLERSLSRDESSPEASGYLNPLGLTNTELISGNI